MTATANMTVLAGLCVALRAALDTLMDDVEQLEAEAEKPLVRRFRPDTGEPQLQPLAGDAAVHAARVRDLIDALDGLGWGAGDD